MSTLTKVVTGIVIAALGVLAFFKYLNKDEDDGD